MSIWFKLVRCPHCNTQREVRIDQKKCKCPNCKMYYEVTK